MTNGMKPWKMGDFLSVKHGYPFQSEHFATEGHYVVVTPGNFYEAGGFKRIPGKEKYFTAQFPAEYLLKKGDLVVAMTQQTAGLLGSTAIIPADDEYLHNQRIGLISFDETVVDKLYLYYLFMTRPVRKQIEDSASGTKIKHTSPDKIYDVVVYLPNLDVQKHVGQLMWDIEQKITNNSCISAELESMAKTLYDYWFVQFDFPDANGKPYRASGGEMIWNEQLKREIPKGWEVTSIGAVTDNFDSKRVPLSQNERDAIKGDIPYYGATGIMDYVNTFIFDGQYVLIAEDGSVMDSKGFPIVQMIWGKTWVNNHAHVLQGINGYSNELLYLLLKQIPVIKIMTGSIQKKINQDNLNGYLMPRIPKHIIDAFTAVVVPLFEKIHHTQVENDELSNLRDWLLPILMNGQATVAPAESAPKLQVLQPEKPAYDPRFDHWLQTQGVAARGTVDEQTLHDIFDAMDDDDKQ